MSRRSVFFPAIANAALRLTEVVVFPTPPFWFTTQRIRPTGALSCLGSGLPNPLIGQLLGMLGDFKRVKQYWFHTKLALTVEVVGKLPLPGFATGGCRFFCHSCAQRKRPQISAAVMTGFGDATGDFNATD